MADQEMYFSKKAKALVIEPFLGHFQLCLTRIL